MNFFILGNPRSGTTLLRLMLNAHSEIGVPPECGMILWWYDKYKNWNSGSNLDETLVHRFIKDILSSKKIEDWNISFEELQKTFDQKPENYIQVFQFLYQNFTNKSIVGDKNNYYIRELDGLNKVYKNSKYIHLVRDGRDVACSYLKIKELAQDLKYIPVLPGTIKTIAQEWNRNIVNIDRFLQNKDAFVLRYEDLLSEPIKKLTELCEFLNVEFEEEMLTFAKHNNEPTSTLNWKKKTLEGLDSNNVMKFHKTLSTQEIRQFNVIAKPCLIKYDYEIEY